MPAPSRRTCPERAPLLSAPSFCASHITRSQREFFCRIAGCRSRNMERCCHRDALAAVTMLPPQWGACEEFWGCVSILGSFPDLTLLKNSRAREKWKVATRGSFLGLLLWSHKPHSLSEGLVVVSGTAITYPLQGGGRHVSDSKPGEKEKSRARGWEVQSTFWVVSLFCLSHVS